MSRILITSDEHIGHANIINLANRPFTSLDEMRETIIERHNKKVPDSKGYLTIHVGDLFWHTLTPGEAIAYLIRLHGRHAFIYGNHDELMEKSHLLRDCFDWVVGKNVASGSEIIRWNKHKILLNHYAHRVWPGSHKGHWHLYGHSHSALPGLGKSFDIGVDGHNFEPWTLEEIEAKMATLPQHHTINNTGEGMTEDVVNEDRTCPATTLGPGACTCWIVRTRSGICQCDECTGRDSSKVEHLPCKQGAVGSSPTPGSIERGGDWGELEIYRGG